MKKVLSLLLSFILLLAVFPVSTISAEALEDDVIEIRTIAELYNINNNMSGNYKLMNDIDMTQDTAVGGDWDFMGNGWEPIGSNGVYGNTAFTGSFDGDGHKIIGMRIVVNEKPSGTGIVYLGLFANNSGTIKNLGIDETSIVTNGDTSGGICAYNTGTISNCYNKADISLSSSSGGICGNSFGGTISNCYNQADITSQRLAGGISGHSLKCMISNCYNIGDISSNSKSGGIVGYPFETQIDNCNNRGFVSSTSKDYTSYSCSGGIAGYSYGSGQSRIFNCYNTGNISSSSIFYSNKYNCKSYSGGITGIDGSGSPNFCIKNCYNTGLVSSNSDYEHFYNSEEKLCIAYSGGISGYSNGETLFCYNTGTTISTSRKDSYNGSINAADGTINSCYYLNGTGSSNTGAKALTSAQLQLEMCMPDFDFENTWVLDKATEYKYPQLISNRQELATNPESIEVTLPDKTSYIVGEEFDPSGMVVMGHYANSVTQEIKEYSVSGFTGELGKNNITVTVGEKSSVFYVTVHDEGEWTTVKQPTCTEKGEKKLYCTDCSVLLDTEEIPAKGHTEVVDKGLDATCTESGLTDGSHCSACDTILTEQEIIPAKGHIPYQNWETIKSPTCISHGEKVRHCSVCGEIVETANIDVTDHQLVIDESKEATCLTSGLTEGSHCSVCNTVIVPQQVIQPKGHQWGEVEVTIQPSCNTIGEKEYHCKNCGQTKSETIPILGHDYSDEFIIDKEASCTEDGLKSKHCSRCDSTTEKTIIPKTSHRPSSEWIVVKEATTTEEGLEEKHCRDCGMVLDSRTIPLLPQLILGDVDGDGAVSIIDATCIQRHIAEIPVYAYIETAADTDGDGEVTILDATSIQRYLVKSPCFTGIGSPIS